MHYRDSDGTRKKLPLTPGQQMLSRRRHLLLAVRPQHPERSEHAVVAARGPRSGDDDDAERPDDERRRHHQHDGSSA